MPEAITPVVTPRTVGSVARLVSFVILTVIVLTFVALFFWVMAGFLLSMFLALILVVIFRPFHLWIIQRCHGRERLAALLTTSFVLLVALVPLGFVMFRAVSETVAVVSTMDQARLQEGLRRVRQKLRLELPSERVRQAVVPVANTIRLIDQRLLASVVEMPGQTDEPTQSLADLATQLVVSVDDLDAQLESVSDREIFPSLPEWTDTAPSREMLTEALGHLDITARRLADTVSTGEPPAGLDAQGWEERQRLALDVDNAFAAFERQLYGDPLLHWIRTQANPELDKERVSQWIEQVREWALPRALSTTQAIIGFLFKLIVGALIMVLSLYYFLADGPKMVSAIMRLSPLDERYERQMLAEFDKVSRAVVVATLLSAAIQGLLAGIGYYVAGLESLFLLTVLTMFCALIPFVGATAVWATVAVYLLVIQGNMQAAVLLAIYGGAVVSLIDNLIKPLILHGQSNIHPLLALLSVLGGVAALGPIGIFVGPMVVAFLQALLTMMRSEIQELSAPADTPPADKGGVVSGLKVG